jgi:hypothetical protein
MWVSIPRSKAIGVTASQQEVKAWKQEAVKSKANCGQFLQAPQAKPNGLLLATQTMIEREHEFGSLERIVWLTTFSRQL